jgi:hypothetical protein
MLQDRHPWLSFGAKVKVIPAAVQPAVCCFDIGMVRTFQGGAILTVAAGC